MEDNVIKISWLSALMLVVFAVLHKFLGVGLIPGVTAISSYFHGKHLLAVWYPVHLEQSALVLLLAFV